MLPFVAFVILQIPCPVTSVIVLYISIGTDLIPAIALAYQPGELDLMTRKPRHKEDHMVTMTLMAQAYGYQGWIEFWGGLFGYYVVFNDFGFPPSQLFQIANLYLVKSNESDVYNPTHPFFGNTNLQARYSTQCPDFSANTPDADNVMMVDWVYTASATYDLRNTMLNCKMENGAPVYSQVVSWGECKVQQISPYTNLPACFTTEACKYAQGAYFFGIVWGQVFNAFVCKTRKLSCISQGMSNTFLHFAITTELMLVLLVGYFQPFNTAFGIRDNIFMHFGTPTIPFCILMLVVDEIRKYYIRSLPADEKGKPHWFTRAALW